VRILLLSDIHSNLEALDACLAAAPSYDLVVNLGDSVGYGGNPNEVIAKAQSLGHVFVRGNHDKAVSGLMNLDDFNPVAGLATLWTRDQLTPENLEWLRGLPQGPIAVNGFLVAHGSPLDEDEYIASSDDAANLFDYLESSITFIGHTHLQGGFAWTEGKRHLITRPRNGEGLTRLHLEPDGIYLINPGSTGQPRDNDPRAAYAIFDSDTRDVTLHRVPYDFERVREKIEAVGLPPALGWRLALGK
jgi:diadenosine tetraphosphatase ApaH/serine/threonine PP2A family protein phosphatase